RHAIVAGTRGFDRQGAHQHRQQIGLIPMIKMLQGCFLALLFGSAASTVLADAKTHDPYQLVQQTTERVLAAVNEGKGYYESEPDRFHRRVATIAEEGVDVDAFARGVMGSYASVQRYNALTTDAEKAAFRERIERFSSTFKQGLVQTYAKGLLKFNGEKIETLPPRKGDNAASGSVSVVQNIYGTADKPYVVQYSMRRN